MAESTYKVLITERAQQKLAAALSAGTKVRLKSLAVGDGGGVPVEPSEAQTALVREVYRADLLSCETPPNAPTSIVCVTAIPAEAGGWYAREIGLFDEDGELFAVGNIAEAYKPAPEEGTSREMLLRCIVNVGTAESVELSADPSCVVATKEYVDGALKDFVFGFNELADEMREWAKLIGAYAYAVLDREEFDALVERGEVKENVIYFVRGATDTAKTLAELRALLDQLMKDAEDFSASHATDVAALKVLAAALQTALGTLRDDVNALTTRVEGAESGTAGVAADAERRIAALEAAQAQTGEALAAAVESAEEAAAAVAQEKAEAAAAALREELSAATADANAKISGLVSSDAALAQRISENASAAAALAGRVAALEESGGGAATAAELLQAVAEAAAAEAAARAALQTDVNENFAKFEAGTSTAETGAKHGKSLLASQNGEDGGFYAAANKSATRAWTQYLTRYQQAGVRAYGATNGEYEDYLWSPRTEDDEPLRVARMKDIPGAGGTLTVDAGNELNLYGAMRFRDGEGNTAVSIRFTGSPTGGVLNQGSASTTTAMTWMSGNYMSWFSSEFLRLYSGDSVISPTAKVEVNPNGVILAAGAGDAAKIVIDAGKIQVSGVALTLNAEPTAANHAATKGYVDAAIAALEARLAAPEGGEA